MKTILIAEDDMSIHTLLKEILNNDYNLIDAYSGTETLSIIKQQEIDLILLDLMLPGLSGEEIIPLVKDIPIIVLSAKITTQDKVTNLLNGAVDYITKPFDIEELKARIIVHLRGKKITTHLKYKELELLKDNRTLLVNDNTTVLTKTEYAILKQLIINQGEILTKTKLLELIRTDTEDCDENSLKVHISHIKKKIKIHTDIDYIQSIFGIGYNLN